MIAAAISPKMFRASMIVLFVNLELFLMYEPRLLKIAEDRLAARPMRAIYLPVNC